MGSNLSIRPTGQQRPQGQQVLNSKFGRRVINVIGTTVGLGTLALGTKLKPAEAAIRSIEPTSIERTVGVERPEERLAQNISLSGGIVCGPGGCIYGLGLDFNTGSNIVIIRNDRQIYVPVERIIYNHPSYRCVELGNGYGTNLVFRGNYSRPSSRDLHRHINTGSTVLGLNTPDGRAVYHYLVTSVHTNNQNTFLTINYIDPHNGGLGGNEYIAVDRHNNQIWKDSNGDGNYERQLSERWNYNGFLIN